MSFSQLKIYCECGAFVLLTPDFDFPLMQIYQLFGQSQPDARALVLTGLGIVDLIEAVEDFIQAIRCDADTGIGDGDDDFGF